MSTKITVIQGDITKIKADAIVNAANTSLLGGGGVDGAIHRAGGAAILEACQQIRAKQGGCAVGQAVITTGGLLPAKYVIHTVGPVWNGGTKGEPELLADCYRHSLQLAVEHSIKSIAFPNISTGIYHFPKPEAAAIAIKEVQQFVANDNSINEVFFVCFDDENYALYKEKLKGNEK
jgi:O-acetyl-ADP-ribose deacetylase